ncbi:MAG: LicD family protein [Propionibacteriaceae bacterium]|nr:LicD family protein [Propionibacteriaceae bacterium]
MGAGRDHTSWEIPERVRDGEGTAEPPTASTAAIWRYYLLHTNQWREEVGVAGMRRALNAVNACFAAKTDEEALARFEQTLAVLGDQPDYPYDRPCRTEGPITIPDADWAALTDIHPDSAHRHADTPHRHADTPHRHPGLVPGSRTKSDPNQSTQPDSAQPDSVRRCRNESGMTGERGRCANQPSMTGEKETRANQPSMTGERPSMTGEGLAELTTWLTSNSIVYTLAEQTLEAALLYGGPPPWEIAQAIAVPRADFDKLAKLTLPKGWKLQHVGAGSWKRPVARASIGKEHVDIVVLESSHEGAAKLKGLPVRLRDSQLQVAKTRYRRMQGTKLLRALASRQPGAVYAQVRKALEQAPGKAEYLVGAGLPGNLAAVSFPSEWLAPVPATYAGTDVFIPAEAEKVLEQRGLGGQDDDEGGRDDGRGGQDDNAPAASPRKRDRFGLIRVKYGSAEWYQLQQQVLAALLDFDALCAEHGLTYYLLGGSLLGAVRHGGFIPWDDDMDVSMPRADFDRLIEIMGDQEQHHLRLFWNTTWPKYYMVFAKMVTTRDSEFSSYRNPLPRHFSKPYVDVFPLDPGPAKEPDQLVQKRRMYRDALFFKKRVMVASRKRAKWKRWLVSCVLPHKVLQQGFDKLARMYANDPKADRLVNFASTYLPRRETFPPEAYGTPRRVLFEGHLVPIPQDADKVLRIVFGDYLRLPPPEQRKPLHLPHLAE